MGNVFIRFVKTKPKNPHTRETISRILKTKKDIGYTHEPAKIAKKWITKEHSRRKMSIRFVKQNRRNPYIQETTSRVLDEKVSGIAHDQT